MRTDEQFKEEIQNLESIKNQFPKNAAIVLEIQTILIALRWARGDNKIPVPSEHIMKFLGAKEPKISVGGIWLPPT